MHKKILSVFLLGLLGIVATGCSKKNTHLQVKPNNYLKEYYKIQDTKKGINLAKDNQYFVTNQRTLESTIASLAVQMVRNKKMNTTKPVVITSFVRLDQFKKTTEFGRVVSESLINDLSNRGFNIIEYRGQTALSVNKQGEYFISREPYKLKDRVPDTYVVVGTYSRQFKKVMLNARVIDNITGRVISSARATYLHGLYKDCIIFEDCPPLRTIKIEKEK